MKLLLPSALRAGLCLAADAPQEAAKNDLESLQGTWSVVTLENDGTPSPPESVKGSTFVVKGDRYTLKGGQDTFRGTLKLDPTKKPKALDATFVDDDGKDKGKAQGIYELDGDRLRICWREGDKRPAEFASKPGSGARLIVLKRQGR